MSHFLLPELERDYLGLEHSFHLQPYQLHKELHCMQGKDEFVGNWLCSGLLSVSAPVYTQITSGTNWVNNLGPSWFALVSTDIYLKWLHLNNFVQSFIFPCIVPCKPLCLLSSCLQFTMYHFVYFCASLSLAGIRFATSWHQWVRCCLWWEGRTRWGGGRSAEDTHNDRMCLLRASLCTRYGVGKHHRLIPDEETEAQK